MLKKIIVLLVSLLFIQIFYSCSSLSTTETKTDVKIKMWNDGDSEVIADSIVNKLLLSEWKTKFTTKRKPILVIGSIENLTNETINTDLLSKNIERSFINSGDVTFIPSKSKREVVRSNRRNKNEFDDKELKKYLKPLNSDFFISGNFKLVIDSTSISALKKYELTLEIVKVKNLELVSTISEIVIK